MNNPTFDTIRAAAVGDSIIIGVRTFQRQKTTLGAQVALASLITGTLNDAKAATVAESFMLCIGQLVEAAAIVLRDYDPACDRAWLDVQTDVSIPDLLVLVLGQVVTDKNTAVVNALAGLSSLAVLSQAIGAEEEVTA